MQSKRGIYWSIMMVLTALTLIICGITITESAKVATLTLDQTVTYEAPENIPVTAYANGGSFASGDTYNTYITFDMIVGNNVVPNPTKTGYTLNGWEYSVDNVTYSSYTNISDNIPFTDHLYLRAKWSANNYTVTFNKQSGSGGSSSVSATYDSAMPSATMPTRTGYTFGGYYDQTGGSGKQYYTSSGASANKWDKTSATALYAKWTANTFYVRFNKNNNDATGTMSNQTFTYGTAQTLTANAFTLDGYVFAGWATSSNGSKAYDDGQSVSNLSSTQSAIFDLYALWEEEQTCTPASFFTYSVTSGESTITGFDTSAITAASLTVADLTDIIFPEVDPNNNPIVAIGDNAFNGNSYIRSIVMPSTYTTVGQGSFKECSALRFVDLGGVSSIGNYSFSTGTIPTINSYTSPTVLQGNLIDVMIADNLTYIGPIDGVRNIFLPSTKIYGPSSGWYGLDCVTSRKFVLDKNSFSLYIWNILGSHGGDASPLEEYTTDANGFCYATVAGAKTLVRYMGSGGNITIPSDVQRIESWVFKGVKLNSVTFANPNGWYANNTSINLSNSSNNAQYLMNTYLDSYWSIGKVTLVQQKYYNVSGLPSITVSCFNVTTSNDILVSSRGAVTACACRPVYTYVAQGTELTITLTLPNINSAEYNTSTTLLYIGGVAYSVPANNQRTYTIGDIDYLIILYHDDSYCFTSDTEVECWDEKRKRRYKKKVKDLKYSDLLIVWNFDEGKFDTAHPLWISKTKHATCYSETVFEDGKILRTVGSNETRRHRLFNMETGRFEYIGSNMKAGTRTFTVDGVETKVKSIRTVYKDVEYYNVISNYHMNLFTSGILTSCRLNNLYEIKDMKFVKDDRELHSREDFAGVSDRYFDGLRLAEQSLEINKETNDVKFDSLVAYAQHLEESAKEDKE